MRQVLWRNKCTLVRRFDKMKTSSPLQITSEYEDKRNEKHAIAVMMIAVFSGVGLCGVCLIYSGRLS